MRALVEDDPVELYETAPCGYLSTDADGRITKANRTFCDWTGFASDDLVGRPFHAMLAPGDQIFYETHFAPSLALQGTVREIAAEIVCAIGDRLPVLLNAVRAGGAGRRGGTRIAVFDARERRAYERELLAERRRAEETAEEARRLAATLQRTLLPATPPVIPGIDVGTAYRAAGDGSVVGGDFFDVFEVRDGSWGISLGDVCGKGAPAAIITALARHTIRALAVRSEDPSEVLRGLHEAIVRSPDTDGFCTALFLTASVDGAGVQLRIAAGGHHLPLLVRSDGTVDEVGVPGHLLGMLPPLRLEDADVTLQAGERLVLYTDGVIEARRDGELFGVDRLVELVSVSRERTAQDLADAVAGAAVEFQSEVTRDDIAVVVLASRVDP
ncbi:MAG: SpoIIE family protein phosphatase [Acidimicrobiia bacterium]